MQELTNNIEAVLFLKGEPVSIDELAKILNATQEEVEQGALELEKNLSTRGIRLVRKESDLMLATAPETSKYTNELIKREFNTDLSRSSLEVLAIVVYKGPVKRSDVDYIRGVNSSYTLRNLIIRGLVERVTDPKDSRSFIYKPSMQLMQYLGIGKLEDLPDFGAFNKKMEDFIKEQEVKDNDNKTERHEPGEN